MQNAKILLINYMIILMMSYINVMPFNTIVIKYMSAKHSLGEYNFHYK